MTSSRVNARISHISVMEACGTCGVIPRHASVMKTTPTQTCLMFALPPSVCICSVCVCVCVSVCECVCLTLVI